VRRRGARPTFEPVTIAGRTKRFCSPQCKARAHAARRAAKTAAGADHLQLADRHRVQVERVAPEPVTDFKERPFLATALEVEDPAVTALLRPPPLPCKL
jgi:hypothetical protein